jgi:hypothetical protein
MQTPDRKGKEKKRNYDIHMMSEKIRMVRDEIPNSKFSRLISNSKQSSSMKHSIPNSNERTPLN